MKKNKIHILLMIIICIFLIGCVRQDGKEDLCIICKHCFKYKFWKLSNERACDMGIDIDHADVTECERFEPKSDRDYKDSLNTTDKDKKQNERNFKKKVKRDKGKSLECENMVECHHKTCGYMRTGANLCDLSELDRNDICPDRK